MNNEIGPGDPEWDQVTSRLEDLLSRMNESQQRRLERDELSFREFCSDALRSIAGILGYTLTNIDEFVRDMAWSFGDGFKKGVARARQKRLRP